ncbi:Lysozyme C-1, partial [Stegodyphus mimosarum]
MVMAKSLMIFLLSSFLPILGKTKIVNPCYVAEVMIYQMGMTKAIAGQWVCLAKFSSGFNTQALHGTYSDGSDDFGIFQINDKYCRKGTKISCGVNCTDLVSDNIVLSAKCATQIFKREGFSHWPAWKTNCRHKSGTWYIQKCALR